MPIPLDVGFGLDDFKRNKVYSESESLARYILTILLYRPGNFPGLPHIGINVKDLLYSTQDELDVENLKTKIYSQCNAILPNIIVDDVYVGIIEYNDNSYLLIRIPVLVDNVKEIINYAFYQTEAKEIRFDFEIER